MSWPSPLRHLTFWVYQSWKSRVCIRSGLVETLWEVCLSHREVGWLSPPMRDITCWVNQSYSSTIVRPMFLRPRKVWQFWSRVEIDMTLWFPANKWYSVRLPYWVWRVNVYEYCIWHILWHLVKYGGHQDDRPTMAPVIDMSPIRYMEGFLQYSR